tara:strand:- start:7196 stop:7315 length:120 start_codon:yes stop_codon:yes gene_type:complete
MIRIRIEALNEMKINTLFAQFLNKKKEAFNASFYILSVN